MIGKTLGHYQITSQLGKGSMGEVYGAPPWISQIRLAVANAVKKFKRVHHRMAYVSSVGHLHQRLTHCLLLLMQPHALRTLTLLAISPIA